ncbi:phosphatase [soil metagenome]
MDRIALWTAEREEISLAEVRRTALARISDARLAGHGAGHPRDVNLRAVQRFIDGDVDCAWNFEDSSSFAFGDVLMMLASVTGCSPDPHGSSGDGYISPHRTLEGIEEAAMRLAAVARGGGRVLLATGHPGALLTYYNGTGELVEAWGGRIVRPAGGEFVSPGYFIDYVGNVAVITDYASLPHTHDHKAMDVLLAAAGQIDLVVADHGYAGTAIRAGLPVIATMDTNDPALAVWKYAGADLTIIPIDDNRPFGAYETVVDLLREFGSRGQGSG